MIKELQGKLDEINELRNLKKPFDSTSQKKYGFWSKETKDILRGIFGEKSSQIEDFKEVGRFWIASFGPSPDYSQENKEYQDHLDQYEVALKSAISSYQRNISYQQDKSSLITEEDKKTIKQNKSTIIINNNISNSISISLDINISLDQVLNQINEFVPRDKEEEAKRIIEELKKELEKKQPKKKTQDLLRHAFKISERFGLAILPWVLEHWDKLSGTCGG